MSFTSQYGLIPKPVFISGGVSLEAIVGIPDLSAFTYGTTSELPVGGVFQDTSPTVTAGQTGAFRITSQRGLHSNLRDSSGNELLGQKAMASSIPVAVASDQTTLNVITQDNTASGNITSTQTITLITTGMGTVGIQVTGTWTGTIVMEGTLDLTNYNAVNAVNITTGAVVSSITANGFYQVSVAGIWTFRVRGNSVGSGTAAVNMRGNPRNGAISLENPLPAGSAIIGAVTQSGTWTVQPGNTANTTPWLVKESVSSTATLTNVASSATNVTLLSSNANRLGATFFNDSTQTLYLKFGATASATSYTVQLSQNAYYELPVAHIYTGQIDGIWAAANGNARITELT